MLARLGARLLPQPTLAAALSASAPAAARCASGGPSNPYPPPDPSRGATADLCDVHVPDPVDATVQRDVQIAEPVFRRGGWDWGVVGWWGTGGGRVSCRPLGPHGRAGGGRA